MLKNQGAKMYPVNIFMHYDRYIVIKVLLLLLSIRILSWSVAVSTMRMPVVTNSCLPPCRCKADVLLAKVCLHRTKPGVAIGLPNGRFQSGGSLRIAAATARWWSSCGELRAK